MTVDTDRSRGVASFDDLGKRLRVNPEFASKLYDALSPGATVVVTDAAPMRNTGRDFTVLAN